MDGGPVTYELHGLAVCSGWELSGCQTERPPDLVLSSAERAPVGRFPEGNTVALVRVGDRSNWMTCSGEGLTTIAFGGTCAFHQTREERLFRVVVDPSADSGIVPRLVESNVLAGLLALRGVATLHTSAIEIDGGAWLFIGTEGRGKSTLAAWLCLAADAALITDDALRVDVDGGRTYCRRGTTSIRLRATAAELYRQYAQRDPGPGVDRRLLVHPRVAPGRVPVTALVFPLPSRTLSDIEVEPMSRVEAAVGLLANPRTAGWQAPEFRRRHFEMSSALAATVPAFKLSIPWGPPFPAETALTARDWLLHAIQSGWPAPA